MLTNAAKYAIRAVLYLTEKVETKEKLSGKDISKNLDIPDAFIAKLLQKLAKAKIVSSSKGPKGGFYMNDKNLSKHITDVIFAIDNKDIFEGCFMGLPVCSDENPCPIHHIVAPFKEQLEDKFKKLTILDFAKEIRANGTHLTLKDINMDIL